MTQYKRLSLCFLTVVVLSVVVGLFFFYHFMMAMRNETTNERYKWYYYYKCKLAAKPTEDQSDAGKHAATLLKPAKNAYNRGLLRNLQEEFFPMWSLREASEKVVKSN